MVTLDEFEREIQEALTHLYDADYQPSEALCILIGCGRESAGFGVQSVIIRAIKEMEPPPDTPSNARTRSIYDLLRSRFILKLTQDETARNLHLSVATAYRLQREAIHTLTRRLWERSVDRRQLDGVPARATAGQQTEGAAAEAVAWRSQAARELASLQARTPDAVADVAAVINDVFELKDVLAPGRDLDLEVGYVQPGLIAAVHPSALRQILIAAVGRLARGTPPGAITIYAGLEDGNAKITITSPLVAEGGPDQSELVRDILRPRDVSVDTQLESDQIFLSVTLPSVGKVTVLAVDDNPDMVDFFRRSAGGTSYHIVQTSEGQDLFETVRALQPDIVVLDVMLPDVDGWKLLMRLYEDPATRPIPVIVCSVVREEELALSLGAALYLQKPVRPGEFIQALDRVRPPAPA